MHTRGQSAGVPSKRDKLFYREHGDQPVRMRGPTLPAPPLGHCARFARQAPGGRRYTEPPFFMGKSSSSSCSMLLVPSLSFVSYTYGASFCANDSICSLVNFALLPDH